MIRLAIICFLISMIKSENCNFGIDDVIKLRQLFHDSERRMEEETRGQSGNAAIVIGAQSSGKSTLINYLMGNELKAYKEKGEIKIRKADNNVRGPEIGAESVLVTTIPSEWSSTRQELKNLDIWDTPGFWDTRSVMQDLINAFHLHHLTKNVDSLKLILVIDFDDINTGVNQILTVLNTLEGYFNNTLKNIFPSISVIISKAPKQINNGVPVNYQYINNKLNANLLSSSKLAISEVLKDFVRHMIKNNQRVAFFRKAEKLGTFTFDINDNIISAINNCDSISKSSHQDIGFTFSANSKLCLQQTNENLLNMNEFHELSIKVNGWFNHTFNALNQSHDKNILNEQEAYWGKLYKNIDPLLDNSGTQTKIQILENITDIIKNFTMERNLVNKINLIEFIDSLVKTAKTVEVNLALENIVFTMHKKISTLKLLCQLKINKITKKEYNEKVDETLWFIENSGISSLVDARSVVFKLTCFYLFVFIYFS